MSHYYTDNKDLSSNRQEFDYYFDNEVFRFTTDNGVFSKNNVDFGSYILIKTIYEKDLGRSLLDLGCGYGPIGIILKRFHPSVEVEMVDVNSRAVELAAENASRNQTDITVSLCEDILTLGHEFDTIVLNPPIRAGKKVIFGLYEKSKKILNEDGHLYIVIRKAQGAASSIKELETLFRNVVIIHSKAGYKVIDCHN
ncbi:MAG: class I SAM-dependent methyltransferase [Erysipelotrichaceae bacterium]|nr:class I SAM-dependent methyltransferase [Erysipelotrichaceae bacterium]